MGPEKPSVLFDQIPPNAEGGPHRLEHIAGRVTHGVTGSHVVLYAYAGSWFVQPYRAKALTQVNDQGRWESVTHLGSEYAVLLVSPSYQPESRMETLPAVGGDILAIATTKGMAQTPVESKVLHFSGYDWKVRSSLVDRGGEACDFMDSYSWVDDKGYLHLRMGLDAEQWHCAGVSLTRSLGYGTYRFVIADSAHLPLSPVLAIFTRSDGEDSENRTGLGIQLSRWGRRNDVNADYVVEPYFVSGNTSHFKVPSGRVTHSFRWEPGGVEFTSFKGTSVSKRDVIKDQAFQSGVPIPSQETVQLDLYDYHHSKSGLRQPVEIVVEKFEYLP